MDRGRPTKKIFFLIVACAIGVGSIGWAVFASRAAGVSGTNSSGSSSDQLSLADQATQNATAQTTAQMEQDSDGDGLANWEEVLWGTDPHNPDTDGDGTSDGDEVHAGRNPLVPGPNDKLTNGTPTGIGSSDASAKAAAAADANKPQTRVQKLSIELFSQYIALKQSGKTLDSDTMNQLIDNVLATENIDSPKTFSVNDILTLPPAQNNPTTLETFGNALAGVLEKYKSSQSEYDIATNFMNTHKPADLKAFDPILANYTAMIAEVRTLTVPASAVQQHVDFLNAMTKTQDGIQLMRSSSDDDMLVMLMGLREFISGTNDLRVAFNNLVQYFVDGGVVFDDSAPGKLFKSKYSN